LSGRRFSRPYTYSQKNTIGISDLTPKATSAGALELKNYLGGYGLVRLVVGPNFSGLYTYSQKFRISLAFAGFLVGDSVGKPLPALVCRGFKAKKPFWPGWPGAVDGRAEIF
jgi:hypothetical protein